jgi:hypothetical protein
LSLLEFVFLKQMGYSSTQGGSNYPQMSNIDESEIMSIIDINTAMEYAALRLELSFIEFQKSNRDIEKSNIIENLRPLWVKQLWKTTVEQFEENGNYSICDVLVLGNERTSMSSLLTGTSKILGITR